MKLRLVITIPGQEVPEQAFFANLGSAKAYLANRIQPQTLSLQGPGPLVPGSKWTLSEIVEREIDSGVVKPKTP